MVVRVTFVVIGGRRMGDQYQLVNLYKIGISWRRRSVYTMVEREETSGVRISRDVSARGGSVGAVW